MKFFREMRPHPKMRPYPKMRPSYSGRASPNNRYLNYGVRLSTNRINEDENWKKDYRGRIGMIFGTNTIDVLRA
jgi:hypothetical protein